MSKSAFVTGGVVAVLLAGAAMADNWPGLNGGGTAANSSPTAIGTNLGVRWLVRLDPQTRNSRAGEGFTGSMRSKNIVLRDGEIALLAPDGSSTALAIYDATLGGVLRAFRTPLTKTGDAEWNDIGIEGRDLRNGQHLAYWHANGNVYLRSSGDNMQRAVVRASDGAIQSNVGPSGSNQSGYFTMSDNSIWNVSSFGGHQGQQRRFYLHDNGGVLGTKQFSVADGAVYNLFTWCGPVLMDGDWIYTLGAATHPDLGWADYTTSSTRCNWLGTFVRGFQVLGQTATVNNQNLVNGINGSFTWKTTNSFAATDHDLASAVKPWCLGKDNIFLVTESASWTATDATVDFSQPMLLTALDRTNGAVAFSLPLGITGAGCWMYKSFGYYGGGTTWRPQVAYADRTSTDGREYVSVLLPEAVETFGSLVPQISPTNSVTNLNTRIAMVDVTARTERWTYQYPRGGTTPVLAQCVNTSTKQIIVGDAVYVVYVKTATNLDNYVSTNILSNLTLYVDRFALANGAKTSFQFPLGVQANTMQLDDLAAADGMLYALVTYREWHSGSPTSGGGQALVALGALTPGNQTPFFTAGPSASPATVTAPLLSVTLNASATDPDGPLPAIVWSYESGPAGIAFSANSSAVATSTVASFGTPGTYVMGCRATDGELSATSNVTVTVIPPLTTVTASVPDNSAAEAGMATGHFVISRSGGDVSIPMTVYYTLGGTASNGVDYALLPTGSLSLPAGVTSTNLVVTPIDDLIVEPSETVTLKLVADSAYNYKLGTTATFTINLASDDQATYEVTISAILPVFDEAEGNSMEVTRNGTINPLVVNYTVSGTASNGVDYTLLGGSVTIPNGANMATIDFDAVPDAGVEPNETVVVTLESGTGYTVGTPNFATATLVDATPVRVVWHRDRADASWASNYWTDAVGQDNFQGVPRAYDQAWIGETTIDTRSNGLNMASVTVADLDVGWRLDADDADDGNLRILADGTEIPLVVDGDLRLANGTNCSGAVAQQGGMVLIGRDLRLACGDGHGPWSCEVRDGQLVIMQNLLIGNLGAEGTNFANTSASPGSLMQTGAVNGVSVPYGDYRVNSGAAGTPARVHAVPTNGVLEVQGNMQIGGGFVLTSQGAVAISGNLELGKSAARSNTVVNVRGGTFQIGQTLDMDEPGEARMNIEVGRVIANALAIRSGATNRISISQSGALWVSQSSYSVAAAEDDIVAGRIVGQPDLVVSTTNDSHVVIACDGGGAGTDPAERWLLVDFHDSDAASTFGTQFPTWNTVLRDAAHTAYVDPDGNPDHKGIADSGASPGDDVTYYGVRGTTPIDMRSPHRVVATFYNNSGSSKTFQARVSFKDPDGALGATWEQPWYQMYGSGITAASGGITLAGYSSGELYLNIADAMHVDAPLAPPTSGTNYLVNITLSKFDPDVVLTKIELSHEQDITPPTAPGNLSSRAITPSIEAGNCVVELTWTPSTDTGEGVSRYHVYRNDGAGWVLHEMVDKAWTEFFGTNVVVYRDYQVRPNTQYTYGVEALDAEINGTYLAPGSIPGSRRGNVGARATTTITTPAFSMPTLIDATSDLIYLGRFRVPSTGNWDGIGMGLAFNPNGNPNYDPNTELPGSLLIAGRQDELTIGEFSIAKPTLTDNIQAMQQATLLQPFVAPFNWTPSGGNAIWHFCGYHPGGNGVGPHIYGSQYRFYASPLDQAHLCAFDMDLTRCWGPWHIGGASAPEKIDFRYSGKFIFAAPQDWADTHVGGRSLIVGNGGAVSGYGLPSAGPSLYAVAPWESGALPAPSGVVSTVELLRYGTHTDRLSTWHDNWGSLTRTHGACWAMGGGKQTVIVSGVIARGDTWYGGSDGSESTTSSYDEPRTLNGTKGYHATLREASLMLFNPADLARVAQGAMAADQPRYYQTLNVQKNFLLNRDVAETENVSIACDQANGYIYVHEKDGETSTRSLMHVWKIGAPPSNQAPTVDAGPDQTIASPASATLDGTVSDDGLPAAPMIVYAWTKESGPGAVTFGDAMLVDTTASFDQGGVYVLRLTATDGLGLAGSDTVTITVLGSVSYAARASGRFNLESTWTPAGGPPRAGDTANIGGGFAVNTLVAGEVPASVTVILQTGGTLRLTDPGTSAIAPIDANAMVNVSTGGTLEIQSENNVVGTINLNGGTIAHNIATGGTGNIAAGATLNINSDSFLSPIGTALARINCPAYGTGKLTLTADAANANNGIAFAAASTWSGAWNFQGYMRFGDGTGFKQRWIPGDARVAVGKTVYCVGNARTIKGTRSGFGMDRLYLDSTTTIGDGTGNGVLNPGDGAGGVGTVVFQAFNGSGNASHTLKFNTGSTYVVDINGTTSNAYDMASSIGTGTGTGNLQVVTGAKLTVNLWTPVTNTVLDATVIDGTGTKLDTGDFAVTWNQTGGWSGLAAAWVGADLHVTGSYTAAGGGDSNGNGVPDAWELHYFGNLTHSMLEDVDRDGMDNHGEWVAGTDPTNAFSRLMLFNPVKAAEAGMVVRWSSESNRFYTLKLSTNLTLDPFTAILSNRMPATPPVNMHTDAVERSGGVFYRIAVENQ